MKLSSGEHTSQIMASVICDLKENDSVTVQEIISRLGDRIFGISVLIFCIPNCLPIPNVTGLSAITGIPIIIIGLHMILGLKHIWLPSGLRDKRFHGHKLARLLEPAIPYIKKAECIMHPRIKILSSSGIQRLLGIILIVMATLMSLPIPFMNLLPGFAMAFIAIGIIERDGIFILLGLALSVVTIGVVFAAAETIVALFQSLVA